MNERLRNGVKNNMDQQTAQPVLQENNISAVPSSNPVQPPPSVFKKFLPLILVIAVFIILVLLSMTLIAGKSGKTGVIPTPTRRPTATPNFQAPSIPMVTAVPASTSATVSPAKKGQLIFIKDGDIYESDFGSYSVLVKNSVPAGNKLSWSPKGNLLAWLPKSVNASPSAVTVYNPAKKSAWTIEPESGTPGEVLDYCWSPLEDQLAVVYRSTDFKLSLYRTASDSTLANKELFRRGLPLKQVFWPKANTVIFSGADGINSLDISTGNIKPLVNAADVISMKLSPDKTRILYSRGNSVRNDLYVVNIDGSDNRQINAQPAQADMGTTGLQSSVLEKGFMPFAVWFPSGDKLIVGYQYLPGLPLAGVYDLVSGKFSALAPFILYNSDLMSDELHLIGTRVNTSQGIPSWQLTIFTLEDNSKLGTVRVIPGASSFAFFTVN